MEAIASMFSHQKLYVYQKAITYFSKIADILVQIPPGNKDIVSQLRRAAISIALNIAEGAGKTSSMDKRRFYSIARGSALECAAIFDLLVILKLSSEEELSECRALLSEIASMFSAMTQVNKKVEG
ncbi:four helix bundle protein [bacterium]|nr:four helix bundle protein [bacterium]